MKPSGYSYAASIKSDVSDELINVYLLRPLAGLLVRILYPTPITPNQVTILSTLTGLLAAYWYLEGTSVAIATAGILVTVKDILDAADGQLARAKQQFSRRGRFLDSIGDVVVNAAVMFAIGTVVHARNSSEAIYLLAAAAFLGTTLRVSYHVFYQTSFLHLKKTYTGNRLTEQITQEDLAADNVTLTLQRVFQLLYGWQDRLMERIDAWCRRGILQGETTLQRWYADKLGLTLSGLMGLGTELFLVMLFSLFNQLEIYLWVNVCGLNLLWCFAVLYRRALARRLATR